MGYKMAGYQRSRTTGLSMVLPLVPFGREKGAFSRAHPLKPGMFDLANSGTCF